VLKAAAGAVGAEPTAAEEASPGDEGTNASSPGPVTPNRPRLWYARQQEAAKKRHERLVERWREIRRLQAAGADVADIARKLGISRRTVYRYKDLAEPPERTRHQRRATVLDPYVPYILKRWEEGCRNGMRLFREIRERGYRARHEQPGAGVPKRWQKRRPWQCSFFEVRNPITVGREGFATGIVTANPVARRRRVIEGEVSRVVPRTSAVGGSPKYARPRSYAERLSYVQDEGSRAEPYIRHR